MNWLLWREYRQNRQLLIAGGALFLLPYLLVLSTYLGLRNALEASAVYSYGLSPLTIAFLGGNAFAGERTDRSAEFMAYLPVSRSRRLVSKLILAAIVTALIWGINLLIFRMATERFPWQSIKNGEPLDTKYIAITGLVMFGVGWCVSSFQSSPTFAVCAGIAAPMLIYLGVHLFALTCEPPRYSEIVHAGYTNLSSALGLAGLGIGIWCFLTRTEP